MKIDPKQQEHILQLLDNHFPDGVMSLLTEQERDQPSTNASVRQDRGPEKITGPYLDRHADIKRGVERGFHSAT